MENQEGRWERNDMEKSIFNFKILYNNGSIIDLHEDLNLWVSDFRIPSPTPEHIIDSAEGQHGEVYLGTTLKGRKVTGTFLASTNDPSEFDLYRDKLFRVFNSLEPFYIIRDLQPSKRMKVVVDSVIDIEYLTPEDGEFTLDFTIHSVFVESIGTTLSPGDLEGLPQVETEELVQYVFNEPSFFVWNNGDVLVNPRKQELKVIFTGASENLKIRNLTTGDEWAFTEATSEADTITLDGIKSFKNGISAFGLTNRKLITLAPGRNDFEIVGALEPFLISFDFRFYYF
jgi:hypothetical protein